VLNIWWPPLLKMAWKALLVPLDHPSLFHYQPVPRTDAGGGLTHVDALVSEVFSSCSQTGLQKSSNAPNVRT
jgi:hypothetical protein